MSVCVCVCVSTHTHFKKQIFLIQENIQFDQKGDNMLIH